MSIWTLALPNEAGGERLLNIITVFLGMVSWEFVIVLSSPQVGYNTVSRVHARVAQRFRQRRRPHYSSLRAPLRSASTTS